MSYTVIKVIGGRRYLYEQRTWREGKRVRTESRSLGPLDLPLRRRKGIFGRLGDLIEANRLTPYERAVVAAEYYIEREQRALLREAAREAACREGPQSLEEFSALGGHRGDVRSESPTPAMEAIVGQERNGVADGGLDGGRDAGGAASRDHRTLDMTGVEESARGIEAEVPTEQGSGVVADGPAAMP